MFLAQCSRPCAPRRLRSQECSVSGRAVAHLSPKAPRGAPASFRRRMTPPLRASADKAAAGAQVRLEIGSCMPASCSPPHPRARLLHPGPPCRCYGHSAGLQTAQHGVSRISPAWLSPPPQDGDELIELERQLSVAIQLEDFTKAAKLRDLIKRDSRGARAAETHRDGYASLFPMLNALHPSLSSSQERQGGRRDPRQVRQRQVLQGVRDQARRARPLAARGRALSSGARWRPGVVTRTAGAVAVHNPFPGSSTPLSRRSFPDMQKAWGQGDHVSCLHPGSDCICGCDEARRSREQRRPRRRHCAGPPPAPAAPISQA